VRTLDDGGIFVHNLNGHALLIKSSGR
jgi:hypothetical protein